MKPSPGRPTFRSAADIACQAPDTSIASRPRTASCSLSWIKPAAVSCVYVYPSPVAQPPRATTTTIVVESHSSVPSDSGASVGIVCVETSSVSTAVRVAVVINDPGGTRGSSP
jgi:hypothetical protein